MKLQGAEKFTDDERAGLSDEELAVLDSADDDTDALRKIAGEGEDTDDDADTDDADTEATAAAAAKAKEEAAAKATAAAEAKAKQEADAKAKAELDAKAKAAADAAAAAAKKAGADDAAQKKAREDADRKAREEAAAATTEATDAAGETDADAAIETADDDDPFVPPYVAPKPDKYDERMAAFDKSEDDITAKFKAGDIELEEMEKQKRAVGKERSALEREMERHTVTADLAEKAGERHWQWEINRFMRDVKKHEGIDYADSIRLNGALDAEVKVLANKAENNDKPGRWFLTEAHKAVKAKLGIKPAQAPGKKDDAAAAKAKADAEAKAKAEAVAKAKAARRPGTDKLPHTLGALPAAGSVDLGKDGEGEFAEINAILEGGDSLKAEAYIAGKSAEWQDRWARNSD